MGRLPDESSVIHINSGTDLGDYAFHEINDLKDWFVEEAPDGSSRWDALPPSHPLSRRRR